MKKIDFTVTKQNNIDVIKYTMTAVDVYDDRILDKATEMQNIIPFQYTDEDGKRVITSYAHEDTTLEAYMKNVLTKPEVLGILGGLTSVFEIGAKGIPVSYIVKDASYIYVNKENTTVKAILLPLKQENMPLSEIPAFFREVVSSMKFHEADVDNYVARILTQINAADFSVSSFKEFINQEMEKIGMFIHKDNGPMSMMVEGGKAPAKDVKVNKLGVMNNMRPQGMPPMGQPMGMAPQGMPPMGQPMGMAPQGQPMGMAPQGMPPMGQPMGMAPQGMPPMGQPMGMAPQGMPPMGQPMPKPVAPQGQPVPQPQAPAQPAAPQGAPTPVGMPPVGQPMPKPAMPPMGQPQAPQGQPVPQPQAPVQPAPEAKTEIKPVTPQLAPQPQAPAPQPQAPVPQPQAPVQPAPAPQGAPAQPGAMIGNLVGKLGDKPVPHLIRVKTGETINITKPEFTLGKAVGKVDYAITDNTAVSRVHCIIMQKNGVNYIKDNGSTNHTYVDGAELQPDKEVLLKNKMTILLGDEEFTFLLRRGE